MAIRAVSGSIIDGVGAELGHCSCLARRAALRLTQGVVSPAILVATYPQDNTQAAAAAAAV